MHTTETNEESAVNVLLIYEFSNAELEQLAAVSPRLQFVRRPTLDPSEIELDLWNETEILYTSSTLPEPEHVPNLRWVQFHSAGVNRFLDHPLMEDENIQFTTASGIHGTPIAEYTFAMFLAFGRKLLNMMEMKAQGEWPENDTNCSRSMPQGLRDSDPMSFMPVELRGTTLGVVGYGSIGREVARLGAAFGMTVLATKRNVRHPSKRGYTEECAGDPEAAIVDRLYPPQALCSMLSACDFVVLTVPLTEETHHLIDAAALAAMKPTAVLVNVSRGEVVDEAALIEALQAGRLDGAALDVFEQEPLPPDSPLWELPNVILSPHTAGISRRYSARAMRLFAKNLSLYLAGEPLLNRVNRELGY